MSNQRHRTNTNTNYNHKTASFQLIHSTLNRNITRNITRVTNSHRNTNENRHNDNNVHGIHRNLFNQNATVHNSNSNTNINWNINTINDNCKNVNQIMDNNHPSPYNVEDIRNGREDSDVIRNSNKDNCTDRKHISSHNNDILLHHVHEMSQTVIANNLNSICSLQKDNNNHPSIRNPSINSPMVNELRSSFEMNVLNSYTQCPPLAIQPISQLEPFSMCQAVTINAESMPKTLPGIFAIQTIPKNTISEQFSIESLICARILDKRSRIYCGLKTPTSHVLNINDEILRFIKFSKDIQSYNAVFERIQDGIRLRIIQDIAKDTEIVAWFTEEISLMMAIPFLTPNNIRGTAFLCYRLFLDYF